MLNIILVFVYTQLFALPGWIALCNLWSNKKTFPYQFTAGVILAIYCQASIYGVLWWFLTYPTEDPGLVNVFAILFIPWISLVISVPLGKLLEIWSVRTGAWSSP